MACQVDGPGLLRRTGHLDFENEQGHRDGEDAVSQRFDAGFRQPFGLARRVHGCATRFSFDAKSFCAWGRGALIHHLEIVLNFLQAMAAQHFPTSQQEEGNQRGSSP